MRGRDRKERRWGERRARRMAPRTWVIMAGAVLGFVVLLAVLIASLGDGEVGSGGRYPNVGDHWHAEFSVVLCGETQPDFPVSSGEVHTHGDGVIHIHPATSAYAGLNANLARFFAGTGSRLTNDSFELPSGEKYTDGDLCPDEQPGQMFLRVNGITMTDIASYVARDGDVLELGFETQ
ncbi:MAG: hypothetical protein O2783_03330 [Chloroflexi bacterium]|nr:hypothetical protein [Chloroflexota bacterium]